MILKGWSAEELLTLHLFESPLSGDHTSPRNDEDGRNPAGSGRQRRMAAFDDLLPTTASSRQPGKRIMHRHAQWLKMPHVAGQDGQPMVLGGGGDDDVGEAGGMTLASGAV